MDFGVNTIQIVVCDLYGRLFAAAEAVSIFSTSRPRDVVETLTSSTSNTDVDLQILFEALHGSYTYGYHHTYYSASVSGWNGNMILNIDNTWGYGPEHMTVETASRVGESFLTCTILWKPPFR